MMSRVFFLLTMVVLFSCSNDLKDIDAMFDDTQMSGETGKDIEIIYSDSARIKVVVKAPVMHRSDVNGKIEEIFPAGIHATFYDDHERVTSWMDSKYAIRDQRSNIIIARDSVVLYNVEEDKMITSELIWEEKDRRIYTDKFVRITQPAKGDTTYGWGFEAKDDFSTYKITNYSAKMSIDDWEKSLDKEDEEKKTKPRQPLVRPKKKAVKKVGSILNK